MFYSSDGISGWSETSKLIASDGIVNDGFGNSVAISGKRIVVGANDADVSTIINAGWCVFQNNLFHCSNIMSSNMLFVFVVQSFRPSKYKFIILFIFDFLTFRCCLCVLFC